MTVEERLKAAIEDAEVLRVTYTGGSQPGAEREIAPISIKNDKVRARCYTSGAVKLFVIDKISIIEASTGESWNHDRAGQPRYASADDIAKNHLVEWGEQGWTVEVGDHYISFHQAGKRGKVLKTPTIYLTYEAETYESVYNMETDDFEEHNRRPRTRPWILRGKGYETKTFKHLDAVAETLKQWACALAPNDQ